jgi:hypothetical protein
MKSETYPSDLIYSNSNISYRKPKLTSIVSSVLQYTIVVIEKCHDHADFCKTNVSDYRTPS